MFCSSLYLQHSKHICFNEGKKERRKEEMEWSEGARGMKGALQTVANKTMLLFL